MKRFGNLYKTVSSIDTIYKAIDSAAKTKKNHRFVTIVEANKDYYANMIHGYFHITGLYTGKQHVDISSGKERLLEVPPFYPDQIIQHALIDTTDFIFKRYFIYDCCCSIKGKGSLFASQRVRKAIDLGGCYFVKFDICKYFNNIDHDILKAQLRKLFKDNQVLALFDEIIDLTKKGIPIGNYTSQNLANLYLTPLDRFIKEKLKIPFYVRYMDDFIILGRNKRKLKKAIEPIKKFCQEELKLETHGNERVFNVRETPVDFCGYRHFLDKTVIRKRVWKRARRCLLRQQRKPCKARARRLACYLGYFKHSDSRNIYQRYEKVIKDSLRLLKKEKKHGNKKNRNSPGVRKQRASTGSNSVKC